MDDATVTLRAGAPHTVAGAAGSWGPFKLIQKVGQGSFGEVYRAFDTALQREVALKLLLPSGLDADAEAKALLQEARALARVRHPNVVPIYGVDRHEGRVGFWSDFVNGKTLSAIVASDGPFGAREAALIGIDLCKAVGAVHAAGLLHRDIKSGNAMRESGGRILLMDFGLTQDHNAEQHQSGTPTYMAPELIAGEPASVASDIYALGILLFHLLSGKYPVDGPTFQAIRTAHESRSRQALLDVRPDLPEPLARVVETAAHPDKANRYKSAGQMISALTEAVGLGPVTIQNFTPPLTRRSRWWIPAGIAVALLLIAFLIPQFRNAMFPEKANPAPIGGVEDDYQKAHDLVEHYYRPRALETAIPLLQMTVQKDPNFAPGFADLGRANLLRFVQERDPKYVDPARQASLQALNLKPDLASAHVTLGILYTWTAKNDLASQELDEAIKLDKFNAAAYAAQGNLLLRQGRNDEGESLLKKAVSLAPNDWGTLMQLGSYYDESGKYLQAGEQYLRAAGLAPDNPRALNNLGLVYRLQARLTQAEAAFRKAIALEPTVSHYNNLGRVLLDEGNYTEAKATLERAINLNPNNYRSWGLLAAVYSNSGVDRAKIEETYHKAISLNGDMRRGTPNDPYLIADAGSYYAAIGMVHESEPLLQQAATLAPDKPDVLAQVAAGFEMLHQRDQALTLLEKAVSLGISPEYLERIPQFSALRGGPRYQTMIDNARQTK